MMLACTLWLSHSIFQKAFHLPKSISRSLEGNTVMSTNLQLVSEVSVLYDSGFVYLFVCTCKCGVCLALY